MFRRLVNAFVQDYPLKLMALAAAAAVWFYANSQLKMEVNVRVPLDLRVLPAGDDRYQIVYQSHDRVQLRMSGPQPLIQQRQNEAATGYLRLSAELRPQDFVDGVSTFEVDPTWLNVPEQELVQTGVVTVEPETIRVQISKTATRKLPVRVRVGGEPRRGYEVRSLSAVPADVEVHGPAVVLDGMDAIRTQEVAVWDIQKSFQQRDVPLLMEGTFRTAGGAQKSLPLEAEPSHVTVLVEVTGEVAERKVEGVLVQALRPPVFPYDVEIPPEETKVAVLVSGLPQDVERVTPESLTAYVSLEALKDQKIAPGGSAPYKEKVHVLLRENVPVTIDRCDPEQVTVVLKNPAK